MDQEQTAPERGQDSVQHENERVLEKLYDQIPKLVAHITRDNAERYAALDRLLGHFSKINDLERAASDEGGDHKPLSLTRIYELAVCGGNADGMAELKAANDAFAIENAALADAIERLTLQSKRSKREEVDALIGNGTISATTANDVARSVASMRAIMAEIESKLSCLQGVDPPGGDKPLDVRMAEELGGFDDISTELLKAVPRNTTMLGKILRRCGLAYDYKDLEAVRQLVPAVLKANRDMSDVIASLTPAREQMERLNEIAALLEAVSGHDVRKSPEYTDALEEISVLERMISRLEQEHGTLAELGKLREEASADFERRKQEQQEELNQTAQKIRTMRAELSEVERVHPETFQKMIAQKQSEIESMAKECNDLEDNIKKLEDRLYEQSAELQARGNKISNLNDRIKGMENGLLLERLEAEIAYLRETVGNHEKEKEAQEEKRKAFEDRIDIWLKNSGEMEKNLETWRNRALAEYGKMGACATGIAGLAGSFGFAASRLLPLQLDTAYYFAAGIGTPMALTAALGALLDREDRFQGVLAGLIAGFGIGLISVLPTIPFYVAAESDSKNIAANALLQSCGESPCQIRVKKDGTMDVVVYATEYKGKSVLLNFPEGGGEEPGRYLLPQALKLDPVPKPDQAQPQP